MVDRASPPTDAELSLLTNHGVRIVCAYVGGINNGGRAWKPSDVERVRKAGFVCLPIYVGQNICPGCDGTRFNVTQGAIDAAESAKNAHSYGFDYGYLIFDLEYDSWWHGNRAAVEGYATAWATGVLGAGFLPILYGPTGMVDVWQPPAGTGYWLADWDGVGDLSRFPHPEHYATIGWQFADNWYGFDVSWVNDDWIDMHTATPETVGPFPNGIVLAGGIAQAWLHSGGLYAFGMPISHEYDITDQRGTVTRQWFERGIAERVPGSFPDKWDVQFMLLGDLLRDGSPELATLAAERQQHADAFPAG